MKTLVTLISAAALSCSIIAVSHAATSSELPQVTVRWTDLNLNQSAGLEQLFKRITTAARIVCRGLDPIDSIAKFEADVSYKKCQHEATIRAVGGVNRPAFTAFVDEQMTRKNGAITLAAR